MAGFSVDTGLFRELGALLVGRDSTALAELIKNSYDADATEVYVEGVNLNDPGRSRILIVDNGNGMTPQEFQRGFLTIAARAKSGPVRFSPVFRRRYTGAKGIGRLAAHKLAHMIAVTSLPRDLPGVSGQDSETRHVGVYGLLDWDRIEARETLSDLDDVIVVEPISSDERINPSGSQAESPAESQLEIEASFRHGLEPIKSQQRAHDKMLRSISAAPHGTTVELTRLRRAWTPGDLKRFVSEIQSYEPPYVLYGEGADLLVPAPLFSAGLQVRSSNDNGREAPFRISLEGEFDRGESFDAQSGASAHYVLEIAATQDEVTYGITRTRLGRERIPPDHRPDEREILKVHDSRPADCPLFTARILARIGKAWPASVAGIRVYMEGFRVLPYGEPTNDWLALDDTYAQRSRSLPILGQDDDERLFGPHIAGEGLAVQRNSAYLGAVYLTEASSPGLQMLVNREGFVPTREFDELARAVKRGVGFLTRTRQGDIELGRSRTGRVGSQPTRERQETVAEGIASLQRLTAEIRQLADTGQVAQASRHLKQLVVISESVAETADDLLNEIGMLRVLASVGTQLTAFVHELNGLLAVAESAQRALVDARVQMDVRTQRATSPLVLSLEELRRSLERQANYLVDVTSADARRRRSAQNLHDRVDAVIRLLAHTATIRAVSLQNHTPAGIKTRPMFRAELMAILTNLLTNAIKAAGSNAPGQVVVGASASADGGVALRVENTGVRVDLEDGERWFRPYATTSTDVDPVLGQGMGLGLAITRSIVSDNGGTMRFVSPSPGFSTCMLVLLPPRRSR